MAFQVKQKIWIEWEGRIILSDGRAALLEAVDELGSIQQAAGRFGMSYRHAWGLIKKIEERAGFKFLRTNVGGKEGGGSQLTEQGREFLACYRQFREELKEAADQCLLRCFKE